MAKKKDDFKYEIVENLGTISQEADIHTSWCKSVLKTLLNDEESGIDIRSLNTLNNTMGTRGIRLTVQEANNLVDILLENGYGSATAIEKAYNSRIALYK